jgi:hypothetical protein
MHLADSADTPGVYGASGTTDTCSWWVHVRHFTMNGAIGHWNPATTDICFIRKLKEETISRFIGGLKFIHLDWWLSLLCYH